MNILNEECPQKYETFFRRKFVGGMRVDFRGWESLAIKEMLDDICLQEIYALNGYICERIVRLFYVHLAPIVANGLLACLTSYILGNHLTIWLETVNQLVGFTIGEAEKYYHSSKDAPFVTLADTAVEFLHGIHINPNIGVYFKPQTRDLNVRGRVLCTTIAHTILSRARHQNLVSYMDLYVMEKLCNMKPFDRCFLILSHKFEVGRSPELSLSYGRLIMKIIESAGIQLSVDEWRIPPKPSDIFDTSHLCVMVLVEENGILICKSEQMASTSRASTSQALTSHAVPMEETCNTWHNCPSCP